MKNGFKFRLNKVLEVKDVEFKQQQKDLSDAANEKMLAYQQLLEKQNDTDAFAREIDKVCVQNARDMHLNYGHYHYLLNEIEQQEKHVSSLEERESQEREKLLKVQRERKVLEKLRERELERFQKEFLKQAQNDIDEIAVLNARHSAQKF